MAKASWAGRAATVAGNAQERGRGRCNSRQGSPQMMTMKTVREFDRAGPCIMLGVFVRETARRGGAVVNAALSVSFNVATPRQCSCRTLAPSARGAKPNGVENVS
jgi:hypothetical protein